MKITSRTYCTFGFLSHCFRRMYFGNKIGENVENDNIFRCIVKKILRCILGDIFNC